ncbi:Na(+)-translocating NADH-quinone reductase subunit A [Devosia albogilva]|uniref:Na(+)-translocating NADH-quinone reductase subunit A n=1 Tax=Devosia albogilva TaxID=429726 RepID=A0ABW5QKU4_9HYPH
MERGLFVRVASPQPLPGTPETVITAEAGVNLPPWMEFRVERLVEVGSRVAQGTPILRDRRRPECLITAPISGRLSELETGAGRRLTSLIVQAEGSGERHQYDAKLALGELEGGNGSTALRQLLQSSGLWMRLRSRPFGKVPEALAAPAAIFVMAVDTRPLAPDPRHAIGEDNIARLNFGLRALSSLCDGPLFFCQDQGPDIPDAHGRLKIVRTGELHPQGLAGLQIHRLFPARLARQVWDISIEDVVAIGQLLSEGRLPETQVVSVAGPGLREARLVRCPPGADLRELCYAFMSPGPRIILSGSVLDGRELRWLGFHDRQVTVLERREPTPRHWLESALRRASRPEPVIATAAVEQALGGAMPGMALLRALSVGDDEAAIDLDVLSLVEEDLALVDYVTAASPRFSDLLRAALNRIEANT